MSGVGRLTCYRCFASYPNVTILRCFTIFWGEVYLCKTCHKRFHPCCVRFVNAVRDDDRLCDVCGLNRAVLVCPQCLGRYAEVQLCTMCHESRHTDAQQCHRDHVREISA